jgi:VIT1/CCC1 family predicted Fe2+/Mn2+ transporter
MKNFIFSLMLLLTTSIYAQDSTAVVGEVTAAERIIDKYSGKAYEAVKELASALKVPAEHVYKVLVMQGVAEGITYLVVGIIGFILGLIGLYYYSYAKRQNIKGNPYNTGGVTSDWQAGNCVEQTLSVILYVIGGLLILIMMFNISTVVTGLINPEYYALKQVMEVFK